MSEDLQTRLAALAREPQHAEFARKLADALAGIRRDFHGAARERLEVLVDEAIGRQLARVAGRAEARAALSDLETSQTALVDALYRVLLQLVPDEGATRH